MQNVSKEIDPQGVGFPLGWGEILGEQSSRVIAKHKNEIRPDSLYLLVKIKFVSLKTQLPLCSINDL